MFSYTYMQLLSNRNVQVDKPISDESIFVDYLMTPKKMKMEMNMFMAMYGVSDRITLMVMSGYNVNNMEMQMLPGTTHDHEGKMTSETTSETMTTKSHGLTDTKIWAFYKLFDYNNSSLMFSGGINIPTGNIGLTGTKSNMYQYQRLPYMMQLGSGSFDLMPGITFLQFQNKLTWSAQVLSVLRLFENIHGYRHGHELYSNAWLAWQFLPWISASARTEINYQGEMKGTDQRIFSGMDPAANSFNYGGTKANALMGLNFYINKTKLRNSKLGFELGIPVYQKYNGIQQSSRFCFNAGYTKSI